MLITLKINKYFRYNIWVKVPLDIAQKKYPLVGILYCVPYRVIG